MIATRSVARAIVRRGAGGSASRCFALAYHSYPLPPKTQTQTPTTPRNDRVPETSITQPEPLPKVHETRPPPSSRDAAHRTQPPASSSSSSPSTTSSEQPRAPPPPQVSEAEAQKPRPAATQRQRPKLRARKAAMRLTPAAVEQLRTLLDRPQPKLIKVGVRNRGCSGLAYHLEYVDEAGAFDEAVEQDGVKVLVDSKALFSIIGSEMDWAEDKLNQRFVFRNPNIKEECGCGESFMV